jgi:hypothetical protein
MQLAYGKYPQCFEDPDVQAVNRCLTRLGVHMRPGLWKVDVFPFLRLSEYPTFCCIQAHAIPDLSQDTSKYYKMVTRKS